MRMIIFPEVLIHGGEAETGYKAATQITDRVQVLPLVDVVLAMEEVPEIDTVHLDDHMK
jgi:hypothetical protein